ncbi:phage portal protein [Actinomadura litoris]|uniref:phage portal protein n=1 Tax=Actinomadura litoris TaxID=2678616 RepID=UPI001FA6D9B4|nr:phage portal protein [Actinomadura litoris]
MPAIDPRLERGLARLEDQRVTLASYVNWYKGEHPEPYIPPKAKAEYKRIVEAASTAWLKLVVDCVNERLKVDGFTDAEGSGTDREAWRIWRRNRMSAVQTRVHREALMLGRSYVGVWPNPADRSTPILSGESALRVWIARDSTDQCPLWAVKSWTTGEEGAPGEQVAYLYEPTKVQAYRRGDASAEWRPDGPPMLNPLGRVPFIEFGNERDLLGNVSSELAPLIPLQERINSTNLHMQLAMLVAAFKQRWAAGLAIPEDEHGNPVEPFNAAVDKLWISDDPNAKFGEFAESNMQNFVTVLDSLTRQMSALSALPAHYLLGQLVNLNAETIRAVDGTLAGKIAFKQLDLTGDWSDTFDLVRAAGGAVGEVEPHWANTEARSEAQLVDALSKLGAPPLNVPQEALWERLGISPDLIAVWRSMQDAATQRAAGAEVAGVMAARLTDVPAAQPDADEPAVPAEREGRAA